MVIVKKTAKDIEIGDVLIIDYSDLQKTKDVSYVIYDEEYFNEKFEGETNITLFEVDDIDSFFLNEDEDYSSLTEEEVEKIPSKHTFYHMDEYMELNTSEDYIWDVIINPNK